MENKPIIYLDYNATTPVDPEVADVMRPWIDRLFGNPSSTHGYGVDARKAVEHAREQVAALLNASPEEIVFTSGGTESDNYAIKGMAFALRSQGNHIITTAVEHPAVLEVCKWLEGQGFRVTLLPVDHQGLVSPRDLEDAILPSTILVSVMHSNNETGTLQQVHEMAAIARSRGIAFHTDAAQSVGKVPVDVRESGVDLLTVAGHKLYAPKGVGALYIRNGVHPDKFIHGAGQEHDKRAGTENILEIAGLGKACEIAKRDMEKNIAAMRSSRDLLAGILSRELKGVRFNGNPSGGLPNTLSVGFRNVAAETLLSAIPGIAASPGAACHAAGTTVSHVLEAMHVRPDYALGTVRFSTGKLTTRAEVETAGHMIVEAARLLMPEELSKQVPQVQTGEIRLTGFTHGLGCACKLRPWELEKVLKNIPRPQHPDLLVGISTSDDAAVYRLNEAEAVVQTVDFFTPVVDDPYDFGAIAAANALSDIYAMGAKPLFALNMVGFPFNRLPGEVLDAILSGANDKLAEAGIFAAGGHSIETTEPLFGMCVTGRVHPAHIWKNSGARAGDAILLTKPLGTGIITTALKSGIAPAQTVKRAVDQMKSLNRKTAEILNDFEVHACTDITGYGLAGHLSEVSRGSGMDCKIRISDVPFLEGAKELVLAGSVPGGTRANLEYYSNWISWDPLIPEPLRLLFCDAQTSGGLLFALQQNDAASALALLRDAGMKEASVIGSFTGAGEGRITVTG